MAYQFKREPLMAEDADRLTNACRTPEERLSVWTLVDSGLRVSELCGLTRENVLWQQGAFRIKGKGGPFGKKTKVRVVPTTRRVMTLLEAYFALHDKWPLGPRAVQKLVKQVANRAGIRKDVTPHVLRHTWATLSIQKGVSLAAVQKALGHDRLETTAIYLNLTEEHVIAEFHAKVGSGAMARDPAWITAR
jgi:integrase/recombinase XerD